MPFGTEDLKFLLGADVDLASVRKTVDFITKELSGPLGPLGVGLGAIKVALGGVNELVKSIPLIGGPLSLFTGMLAGLPDIFGNLTSSMINFARVASPMTFDVWTKRLADVQGVIGRAFVPVLEVLTDAIRLFGDVLANILPSASEVRGALSSMRSVFATVAKDIRDLMAQIGPDIREMFINALKQAAYWLAVVARALGTLVQRLTATYKGMVGEKKEGPRTAFGAAATPARITSFDEYQRNLQTMFASAGTAVSPQERAAKDLDELLNIEDDARNLVESIDNAITGVKDFFTEAWQDIKVVVSVLGNIASGVATLAKQYEKINLPGAMSDFNNARERKDALDKQLRDLWKRPGHEPTGMGGVPIVRP